MTPMVYSKHAFCRWCHGRFVLTDSAYWLCETPACAERQLKHAMPREGSPHEGESNYLYVPTPAQVELREATVKKVLWGGAAGGAKSHGLRWDAYFWCMKIPNYEVVLMRRTFPELEATHLLRMEREQELVGAAYKPAKRIMEFPNGSFIKAMHCESKGDLTKLLSTEYDDIRIDEASTFERELQREISSRARSGKPLVQQRGGAFVRVTSNPGGVGSMYLRDVYIDKNPDPVLFPNYDRDEYAFIPARVNDNPYLDPSYEKELKQLDPARCAQLLNGDWSVFEGQFFPQFSPETHVVTQECE